MFVKTEDRMKIYQLIFQEGVMVAKKEFGKARHISIDVPNYQVIKVMQSLNSLGCVKTHFSWGYYYYNITNEGIEFVRKYLGLPNEIVPRTILSQPLVTASSGQKSRTDDPGMERGSRLIGPRRGRQGMDRYQMGRSEFEREGEGDRAANWRSEYRGGGIGRGAPMRSQEQ